MSSNSAEIVSKAPSKMPIWLRWYLDKRMLWVLLIGMLSGYPWALFGTLLTFRMQDAGVSRGAIGLFGLVGLAYALNLLWAPLVDAVRLPVRHLPYIGTHRKSWILLCQLLVLGLAAVLAFLPVAGGYLLLVAAVCVAMAAAGATQDVAVDALRIELIGSEESERIAPAAAMATTGWWLGFSGLGALLVFVAQAAERAGIADPAQWALYCSVPLGALVWLAVAFFVKEPPREGDVAKAAAIEARAQDQQPAAVAEPPHANPVLRLLGGVWSAYSGPVLSFLRCYGVRLALLLLAVIFLFKIGEAFLGRMSIVFYRELGLEYSQIGFGKLASTVTVCISAIIGSAISARWNTLRGLLVGGVLMAATNLLFAQLARIGPDTGFFLFAIVADQITSAISTVTFVAFISHLCDRRFAATQYAALASLGNLSRTTLAASSGFMVTSLGGNWSLFFVITAVMVLPSLILLWSARKPLMRILQEPVQSTAEKAAESPPAQ